MKTPSKITGKDWQSWYDKLACHDAEIIHRLLEVMASKSMFMKKRGLNDDIETCLGHALKEAEQIKVDWLIEMQEKYYPQNQENKSVPGSDGIQGSLSFYNEES